MQDPENYLKAFALLKNSKFAALMESTESVHRSFAESMKDNGEEKLMFGMLEMIKDLGGLVGFQESTQINQKNSSVNIRAWETIKTLFSGCVHLLPANVLNHQVLILTKFHFPKVWYKINDH